MGTLLSTYVIVGVFQEKSPGINICEYFLGLPTLYSTFRLLFFNYLANFFVKEEKKEGEKELLRLFNNNLSGWLPFLRARTWQASCIHSHNSQSVR